MAKLTSSRRVYATVGYDDLAVLRRAGGTAFSLWVYLDLRAGRNETAWPSYATIQADTGFAPATIRKALTTLEDAGLLRVERRRKGGRQTSNRYEVRDVDQISDSEICSQVQISDSEVGQISDSEVELSSGLNKRQKTSDLTVTGGPDGPRHPDHPDRVDDAGPDGDGAAHPEPGQAVARMGHDGRKPKPIHQRLFDGLVLVFGDPPASGTTARGAWNRAVRDLTRHGLTDAADVVGLADRYRSRWPDIDMTPIALANNAHHLMTSDAPRPKGRRSFAADHADQFERIAELERQGR